MSAADPWDTLAIFSPVAGFSESKCTPSTGCCHSPPIKWPKVRLWRSSQASASLGSSGAGPYSMVRKFSAMLMRLCSGPPRSCDRMPIICRVVAGCVMLELPLNVVEKPACAEAEEFGFHPRRAKFFFHEREPFCRLLRSANTTGGLEAYGHTGFLSVFPDGASHDKANRQGSVGGFLAG